MSEANPYDRPFEAESLGRFWALQAVRRAIAPFSIRRPHSEFPFFGEALTPEQREQVAERVAALAEAAAPGTGLAELAGGAVNDGFRDEDMRALGELCDELQQPIVDELKAAGPSRQKTIASLVSMFQNGDIADSDDDLLDAALIIGEATAPEWRVAVQEHWAQRSEAARNDIGPMFWRRTEGSYENVLRYRVGTELGIEGLDEVWRLVEREVRQTLAEGPHPLAFDLAHVALSAELAQGAADGVRLAVTALVKAQADDGSWRSGRPDDVSAVAETTNTVVALGRLGYEEAHRVAARAGAGWLMSQQEESGAWLGRSSDGAKPCPLVTARAVEALVRAALPGAEDALARAVDWLWAQQDEYGFWQGVGVRPGYYATARVMEALDAYNRRGAQTVGELLASPPDVAGAVVDPVLRNDVYEAILDYIRLAGRDMEQSPVAYLGMAEETRRHMVRLQLNGPFRGLFSAETENVAGKTDLLLRFEGANLFIGECKFWSGKQGFLATVDQLLGYAGWKDRKLAMLMFVRRKDPGQVLARAREALEAHDRFVGWEEAPDGELRATVRLVDEGSTEATLHVFFIHTPDPVADVDEDDD